MLSMQHESAIKKQSLITPIATEIMGDEIRNNNGQPGGGSEELKRELTTTKNHTFIPAIPIPLLVQKELETDATDKMEEVQPDLLHSRLTNGINVHIHRHRKQTSNDMEIVNGDEYIYTYPSKADSPIPSSSPSSPDTYTPPRIGLRLSGGGSSTNLSVYMASGVGGRDNGMVGRGNRLSTSAPPIPFIRKLSESTMLMNNNLSSSPNSSPSTSPNSSSTNLAMRTIERRTSNLRIDTSSLSCHSPDPSSTSSSPTLFSPLATPLSSSSSGHSRTLSRPTTPTLTQLDAISLGLSSPRSGGSPRSGSPDSPRSMLPRSASDTPRKKTADDFILGRVLGEGSYGAVVEGTDRETGAVYAIKILEKNHILKEKKEKYVRTERDILGRCFHPGIVKLFYTFRSEHSLYYVLELAPNGELLGLIKQYGGLHEKCVQFYAAELVEVLEYLHSKGIVHRDLKPENILLSADYHLKLTDFGTAKLLGTERNARSNSFVGTAAYVSPELITSKETCCASDLWALGNIIYQMLAVRLPFRGKTDFLTFQSVSARKFSFPLNFPPLAKDLIENLFALNPEERIGARVGGYEELKSHPFFAGINWATLREQQPPLHKGSAVELIFDDLTPPPSPNSQLFRTTSSGFLSPIFSNSPSSPRSNNAETRKWGQFLNQNEAVTHAGLVWKRKGLSIKKRYLILTNAPRLLYIEPKKLVLRGEIPFSEHLHPELKNSANFYIHTPKRKYILEDTTNNAQKWVDAIQSVVTAFKDEVKSVLQ